MGATLPSPTPPLFGEQYTDRAMPFLRRKQTGSFYTADNLTIAMMEELVRSLSADKQKQIYNLRFLEPCVGAGSFVFAYLAATLRFNFTREQYQHLLNNIYVCDINQDALNSYSVALSEWAMAQYDICLDEKYFNGHAKCAGLLFNLESNAPEYTAIEAVFGNTSINGFDMVVTNPPYKNLKAERSHYPSQEEYDDDKARYSSVTRQASRYLNYSVAGVNNIRIWRMSNAGITQGTITASILTSLLC